MQAQNRGNGTFRYHNSVHAYRSILKHEGLHGLWKGFVPNIVRNSVVNVAELVCYDTIKDALLSSGMMRDGLVCHFSAGLSGKCYLQLNKYFNVKTISLIITVMLSTLLSIIRTFHIICNFID
jgi:hypothetical protein